MLPRRAENIAQIKTEFMAAAAELTAKMDAEDTEDCGTEEVAEDNASEAEAMDDVPVLAVWDAASEMSLEAVLRGPVRSRRAGRPTVPTNGWHRPLPPKRRDRAMKARARRERRANAARAQQLQGANGVGAGLLQASGGR